jgi:uncharacterized membrane protein
MWLACTSTRALHACCILLMLLVLVPYTSGAFAEEEF